MTDAKKNEVRVFYDAECAFCTGTARRFTKVLERRNILLVPLQTPGAAADLGVEPSLLLDEVRALLPDGTVLGGADVSVEVARRIWWAWPLWLISRIPGMMPLFHRAYKWYAPRRYCFAGKCKYDPHATPRRPDGSASDVRTRGSTVIALLPLMVIPPAVVMFARSLDAWVFMWALAFALYAGCKWLTLLSAIPRPSNTVTIRRISYLTAWPGMDATAFLGGHKPALPPKREWAFAVAKILFGVLLIWAVVPLAVTNNPLIAGWVGMIGVVFVLHFGFFHLLSLFWRTSGINATPLMKAPILARSVTEFWGRRWNAAFHELVARFLFRPLSRVTGTKGAMMLVFLASGLVHDMVISVPARGGYGLPTLYFLIQGLAILAERTDAGRRLGLGHGLRGRLFMLVVTAGPAWLLFHPPFVTNVILPMLKAIGAT